MTRDLFLCSLLFLMVLSLGGTSVAADLRVQKSKVVPEHWGGIWVDDSAHREGKPPTPEVLTGMFISQDQNGLFIRGTDSIIHWEGSCTLVPGDKKQARCRGTAFRGHDRPSLIFQSTFTMKGDGELQEEWTERSFEEEKSGTNKYRRIELGYSVPGLSMQ